MHILPWCRRLLTLATTFCLIACNSAVLAETTAGTGGPAKAINLDLTSTVKAAAPVHLSDNKSVNIVVGGNTQTITAGSQLTAAERVAVFQVMRTGQQSIQLGAQGNAVGGSFTIGARLSQHISNLVIPAGVTAVDNASRSASLNLTGNLTNAGTLYVLSTNPAITTATISAANISNLQGALLSTILPAGGLPGFSAALANLNLSLNAVNSIVNAGRIQTAGTLTATAGSSITNTMTAVMQAVSNVNLQAPNIVNQGVVASQLANINALTASLTNSGTIQALSGSIAIQNLTGNTLSINNTLGTIAAKDNLLFETLATVVDSNHNVLSKANLLILGGNLSAGSVFLTSPDGNVDVETESITGGVHVDGGIAMVGTNHGGLDIVSMHVSSDPIFFSHDQNAGLVLSGLGSTAGGDFIALVGR